MPNEFLNPHPTPPLFLAFNVFATPKEKREICIKETKKDYQR
jgi:hypothetical protein